MVWRICRDMGWWSVFGKPKRAKASKPGTLAHDDLVRRNFTARPNTVWLADITEHRTGTNLASVGNSNRGTEDGGRVHTRLEWRCRMQIDSNTRIDHVGIFRQQCGDRAIAGIGGTQYHCRCPGLAKP